MSTTRKRTVGSVKVELIKKSREAAMSAVQTFNNPLISFKSETFIVMMTIAWTYLLHAYYREQNVEHRYRDRHNKRRFQRNPDGTYRYWELTRCINTGHCPLDSPTKENLRFLIGLRNQIVHHRPPELDSYLSGRYQACALNYCRYLRNLFGESYALEEQLSFAIQFSAITKDQITGNNPPSPIDLPSEMRSYIAEFDNSLSDEDFLDDRFGFRVYFVRKSVNHRGQADAAIEFVDPDSEFGQELERAILLVKEKNRPRFRAKEIVKRMGEEGYPRFRLYEFVQLWKAHDAKSPSKGYGEEVVEGVWIWFEEWVDVVRKHCEDNAGLYQAPKKEMS